MNRRKKQGSQIQLKILIKKNLNQKIIKKISTNKAQCKIITNMQMISIQLINIPLKAQINTMRGDIIKLTITHVILNNVVSLK
ncbi:TPA: hypothetical protein ACXNDR_001465 [Serratia marcescens]